MISSEKLIKELRRTTAYARRRPHDKTSENNSAKSCPHRVKGFGHILDLLMTEDGITQQQIADQIGIRPQSVSQAIAAMESNGFIHRSPSTTDKRAMLIYVTDKGKEHYQRISSERSIHAEKFFSALSESEKEELFILLNKINQYHDQKTIERG